MIKDFMAFVKEYNIIGLAVAFVMGAASNSLVKSLVDDIVMPFLSPIFSKVAWQEAVLVLGPVHLRWGAFMSELLHFLILALIVFIIIKKLVKRESPTKAK